MFGVLSFSFSGETSEIIVVVNHILHQWRAEGQENGAMAPGIQGRGGIQRVKLQKLKCCNWMLIPTERLLAHAA